MHRYSHTTCCKCISSCSYTPARQSYQCNAGSTWHSDYDMRILVSLVGHHKMSRDMTKPTKWVCAQRRLRSAWASAQSDQSLRCAFNGQLRTQAVFMRTAKTLIRLGRCPGWSESSMGAHSFCWFCHVAAEIDIAFGCSYNPILAVAVVTRVLENWVTIILFLQVVDRIWK